MRGTFGDETHTGPRPAAPRTRKARESTVGDRRLYTDGSGAFARHGATVASGVNPPEARPSVGERRHLAPAQPSCDLTLLFKRRSTSAFRRAVRIRIVRALLYLSLAGLGSLRELLCARS